MLTSCFSLFSNSIGLGNFLMKAAGTKACYDSIFEKKRTDLVHWRWQLERIFLHITTTYTVASSCFQKKGEFAAALAFNPMNLKL